MAPGPMVGGGGGGGGMPMRSVIMPLPMMGGFGYGFGAPMMMYGGGGGGLISLAFTAIFVLAFIDTIKNMFGGDTGVQIGGGGLHVVLYSYSRRSPTDQ